MKLIIGDKLNFLMQLTHTKNTRLGKEVSFDPSYISRIRTGTRGVPKHRDFIYPVSAFFAQVIRTKAQKEALAGAICPGKRWPEDINTAIMLIANWLKDEPGFDEYSNKNADSRFSLQSSESAVSLPQEKETGFYYGNAGKRECVIQFLSELAALDKPVKLLLHSEEDMVWIYENPDFVKSWSVLLKTILLKGGRIVIVHTVRRALGEMLEAIAKWSPLYATGHIESYYCPRLRDNIFKRTVFIGSGKAAILGHTTGEAGKNRLNILLHDKRAVEALEKEFHDFLSLCRPLMKIYNSSNFAKLGSALSRFPAAESRTLQYHATPSWLVMPEAAGKSLSLHPGCELFYDYMCNCRDLLFLRKNKPAGPVTDIFSLPGIPAVVSGSVPVPLADLFGLPSLCYTAKEFHMHLAAALNRFKTSDDYHIVLPSPDNTHPITGSLSSRDFSVIANETGGVILYRSSVPSTLFFTKEQDMTVSFCEYLEHFEKGAASRQDIIETIQHYLDKLEEAMKQNAAAK